jgi:hypothetical protein
MILLDYNDHVLTDLSWEQGSIPGDIVCLDDTVRLPW